MIKEAEVVIRKIEKDRGRERGTVHVAAGAVEEKNGEAEVERGVTEVGAMKGEIRAGAGRGADTEVVVRTEIEINIHEVVVEAEKESKCSIKYSFIKFF